MNKNHKIGLIIVAIAVTVPLILLSATYQGSASTVGKMTVPTDPSEILIDFSIDLGTEPIVVEKGRTVMIPIKVEAPNDAEKTLLVRLAPERGNIDPDQLDTALSETTVVLSKADVEAGKVADLGNGRGLREVAMLTLTPPSTMAPGNYTFGIEVEEQVDQELADALVAGTLVRVQVK